MSETQKHLNRIEKLEQELTDAGEEMTHVLFFHTEIVMAIKLFLTFHMSVWISRVFRFDEDGKETRIGDIIMEEAEKLLPKLEKFKKNDHILHIKLSHTKYGDIVY